ncbi:MAG: transglycosylase SLT domain-containing protein [Stygiobacter sp.]
MEEITLKASNDKHFTKPIDIKSRYDEKQKEKIASASKQFESVLTAMMLKSMNKTTGGLFGDEDGYGNDMFDTIFEQEIAQKMSATKSLGIAEILYRKITGENMPDEFKFRLSSKLNPIKVNNTQVPADATKVKPSNSSLERIDKFNNHIEEASKTFGVDKVIIKSIILAESAGNHKAVSTTKAKGLMQLMDSTAIDMGVKNVFNPKENIFGGTKYFAQLFRQYSGDLKLALAAYNAGPQNVEKYNGIPPFAETKSYINKVLSYLEHFNENQS